MHQDQFLRVGKGKLQVVVRMEAHADAFVQVMIYQVIHAQQIVLIHGAQRIDEVKGKGAKLVHFIDQIEQRPVAIRRRAYGLEKYFIPLFFQLPCED